MGNRSEASIFHCSVPGDPEGTGETLARKCLLFFSPSYRHIALARGRICEVFVPAQGAARTAGSMPLLLFLGIRLHPGMRVQEQVILGNRRSVPDTRSGVRESMVYGPPAGRKGARAKIHLRTGNGQGFRPLGLPPVIREAVFEPWQGRKKQSVRHSMWDSGGIPFLDEKHTWISPAEGRRGFAIEGRMVRSFAVLGGL